MSTIAIGDSANLKTPLSETTKNLILIIVSMLTTAILLIGSYCAALYTFSKIPKPPIIVDFNPTIEVLPAPVQEVNVNVDIPKPIVHIQKVEVPQPLVVPPSKVIIWNSETEPELKESIVIVKPVKKVEPIRKITPKKIAPKKKGWEQLPSPKGTK